jgi:hypothetical protein
MRLNSDDQVCSVSIFEKNEDECECEVTEEKNMDDNVTNDK